MKYIIFSLLIISMLVPFSLLAQADVDEGMFEVVEPGLTPDSPFYFLDNLFEKVSLFFTINPEKKIKKSLVYATEKISEAKVMIDQGKEKGIVQKSLSKYLTYTDQSFSRLEKDKIKGRNVTELQQTYIKENRENQTFLSSIWDYIFGEDEEVSEDQNDDTEDQDDKVTYNDTGYMIGAESYSEIGCGVNSFSSGSYSVHNDENLCKGRNWFDKGPTIAAKLCQDHKHALRAELEKTIEQASCPDGCSYKTTMYTGEYDLCTPDTFGSGSTIKCWASMYMFCHKPPKPRKEPPPFDDTGEGAAEPSGSIDGESLLEPTGPVDGSGEEIQECSEESAIGCQGAAFGASYSLHPVSPCKQGQICQPYSTRGEDGKLKCFCEDPEKALVPKQSSIDSAVQAEEGGVIADWPEEDEIETLSDEGGAFLGVNISDPSRFPPLPPPEKCPEGTTKGPGSNISSNVVPPYCDPACTGRQYCQIAANLPQGGACWSCQNICKEGYFADVLECERVCAEQDKKCGGDAFGALDPSLAARMQVSCFACEEKEPEPSLLDIFWEILDIDAGWTPVSTLTAGHRVHLIVASNGDPDIRSFLPIDIELLVIEFGVGSEFTIENIPQQNCRDATGCSIDGGVIQSSWKGQTVKLTAHSKDGKLLVGSQFDVEP